MALEVEYTQEDVDKLKAMILANVRVVSYSGPPARTVEYGSIEEMKKTLAEILAKSNNASRQQFRLAAHDKGF